MDFFKKAVPVFYPELQYTANAQIGFYTELNLDNFGDGIKLNITGRNLFRLYINGAFVLQGPARTAHGYARVDTLDIWKYVHAGKNEIAVEVVSYGNNFGCYSNDCTLESAMLICEITDGDAVLSATGDAAWKCHRITERDEKSERISHCRQCAEVYHLTPEMYFWINGGGDFTEPEVQNINVRYLPHNAKRATLDVTETSMPVDFGGCYIDYDKQITPPFFEGWARDYFDSLPERPMNDCKRTVETASFDVSLKADGSSLIFGGEDDKFAFFDIGESHVGFFSVDIEFECEGILDVVHTELMKPDGAFDYPFNSVTRLHIPTGRFSFIATEPSLARYIKLYMRTPGNVILHRLYFVDFFYPDTKKATFLTSSEEINKLYEAAKRTLMLNTMDIFMDCPDRERGGWLCDSLWTARAARLLLSDTSVEREFMENFLLTPADGNWNAFFPEVFPANKGDYKNSPGITTWSFWLMCEVCEYVKRTADRAFAIEYFPRIKAFVEGTRNLIGKSGLLERLPNCFIDWSPANDASHNQPISVAANSLYAYMLDGLGTLYEIGEWKESAKAIRGILRKATNYFPNGELNLISDGLNIGADGNLIQNGTFSEAAAYTAFWSRLWNRGERPEIDEFLINCSGPAPKFATFPTVAESGLFIGLCIRLDLMSIYGEYGKMLEDLKAIYLPQLKEGPGTLWENRIINTSSRCHGFSSHAGVLLVRDILGVSDVDETEHIITIAPHPCGLRWASGALEVGGQILSVSWKFSGGKFILRSQIPEGYFVKFNIPSEIEALGEDNVIIN